MHCKTLTVALGAAACYLSLIVPVCVAAPEGTVYYVATTGNDSNPGTLASPWRTIQKAADTMVAGDTVYIRAGTYRERVEAKGSGTDESHRITYSSYAGEKAVIDGKGIDVPEYVGLFHMEGKRYVTVSGLTVTNSSYYGINADNCSRIIIQKNITSNTASCGIGVWTCSYVIVDGNDVSKACSGGQQEAISVAQTRQFEVRNNHVHDTPDKEGICIKDGSSYGKVFGNNVHHTSDVGIYLDAWERRTHHIDVYRNVIHDVKESDSCGMSLASEMGGLLEIIRIYNNIIYRNPIYGIEVSDYGAAASRPMRRIEIVNNTLWSNGHPWGGGITCQNPDLKSGSIIRNNICSQNSAFQIAVAASLYNKAVKVDHNLINRFMGEEGEVRGTAYVEADPLLVDPAKGNFHLDPDSPAIDMGSATKAPASDYDANPRPLDGDGDGTARFDIGAFEAPAAARVPR
ncbi:MAG: right-handed parallel beta-helix repeat-containing protein [Acidobacteriota bacterium]